MRLHFRDIPKGKQAFVTLDGVDQRGVVEAESGPNGRVVIIKRDADGKPIADRARGKIETEVLVGNVTIKIKDKRPYVWELDLARKIEEGEQIVVQKEGYAGWVMKLSLARRDKIARLLRESVA